MKDVFLCHAGEDKKTIVRPIADECDRNEISCWVDEAEILWGDSIIEKVNEGLKMSQYVIVVLSESFIAKNFPKRELYAALNLEIRSGEVKVLPLLAGDKNARQKILDEFPILSDKRYLVWDGNSEPVIEELKKRLGRQEAADEAENNQGQAIEDDIEIPKIKRQFSRRDKDVFLRDSFQVFKSYFQRVLSQLEKSYDNIETDFMEINEYKFVCSIYSGGDLKCQCKIWLGGMTSLNSICYAEGTFSIEIDNSYNEQIGVEDDGYELFLRPLFGSPTGKGGSELYKPQDSAKMLWERFISPLTR